MSRAAAAPGRFYRARPIMPRRQIGGVNRYVIIAGEQVVVERQDNGLSSYLTYKTLGRARAALFHVVRDIPEARIYDKEFPKPHRVGPRS